MPLDPLLTLAKAADALGINEDDVDALADLIDEHKIRSVTHQGRDYLLGADVQKALDDRDPRKLAAKVPRL